MPAMLNFNTDQGSGSAYLATLAEGGGPGVLVLHAWWGLNLFFKHLCDRLAQAGFVALAPGLKSGQVAMTIDEAKQMMSERDFARAKATTLGACDALRSLSGVRAGGLGAVGFSMGASWAAYLSVLRPADLAAAVLFYGTETADFGAARANYQGTTPRRTSGSPTRAFSK
jgi:carboxymethylenebutenolidase